ncbi:MAG: glycosyltransferase [Sphingomonas sp.]
MAALPRIIDTLRAQGYTFVPVSTLAGLTREAVMPRVSASELAAVRFDVGMFKVVADVSWALRWLFFLAIALGMGRAVLMTALAVSGRNRNPPPPMPEQPPRVSVIIPAYNEERVIEASVRGVLASENVVLEVIVADDGSSDRTSEIVAAAFGGDPRVRLLTLVNGGKAAALNRSLEHATAPIIRRARCRHPVRAADDRTAGALVRRSRLRRGRGQRQGRQPRQHRRALAGDRICDRAEFERRAPLARFDAMMVVPGAVGAWRREALDDVGGYPIDTLAEGPGPHHRHPARRLGASPMTSRRSPGPRRRKLRRARQAALPLGVRHAAMPVEAPRDPDRSAAGRAGRWSAFPQTWLFQILFAAISPLIDLALLVSIAGTALRVSQHGWAQTQTDVLQDGSLLAAVHRDRPGLRLGRLSMEKRERRFPGLLLLAQRFVYRQVMYMGGDPRDRLGDRRLLGRLGKLERSGRATAVLATCAKAGSAGRLRFRRSRP